VVFTARRYANAVHVVQTVSTVDKILADSASRGPSAVAEFLARRKLITGQHSLY